MKRMTIPLALSVISLLCGCGGAPGPTPQPSAVVSPVGNLRGSENPAKLQRPLVTAALNCELVDQRVFSSELMDR